MYWSQKSVPGFLWPNWAPSFWEWLSFSTLRESVSLVGSTRLGGRTLLTPALNNSVLALDSPAKVKLRTRPERQQPLGTRHVVDKDKARETLKKFVQLFCPSGLGRHSLRMEE